MVYALLTWRLYLHRRFSGIERGGVLVSTRTHTLRVKFSRRRPGRERASAHNKVLCADELEKQGTCVFWVWWVPGWRKDEKVRWETEGGGWGKEGPGREGVSLGSG